MATPEPPKIFLDTSALFSAFLSKTGGAREIVNFSYGGAIQILVSANVLREIESVLRRKSPQHLESLLRLLDEANVTVSLNASARQLKLAKTWVSYEADADVLADAIASSPSYFVTLDKKHFLSNAKLKQELPFPIGTPGDLLAWYREQLIQQSLIGTDEDAEDNLA